MDLLHFEDFKVGDSASYPGPTLTAEEIIAFAQTWDPQPMHTDPEAAKTSFVGGLIASGWHTAALHMRMITDDFLLRSAGMGSGGLTELRWLKPVRPGDALTGRRTVLDTRASTSKPDRGVVTFRFDVSDGRGEPLMRLENGILFARREPGAAAPAAQRPPAPAMPSARPLEEAVADGLPAFDAVTVGEAVRLGSRHFTAESIKAFARQYDPQPFHLDDAAAERSHFGGLVASGWETAIGFMPHFIAYRGRQAAASRAAGRTPPELGPSPGVRGLKWIQPVRAGDTVTYINTVASKRRLASRPGWGLVTARTDGFNQHGAPVFTMEGASLWEAP